MSQVNVNDPGGYRGDDGGATAAAGINLMAVVLIVAVIIAIVVVAYGAFAGNWFGSTGTGGNTTINVSAPAGASPAANRAPAGAGTGAAPAASR